ncbi:3-oxoacyl-[acyl-carrier-protein] reductase [Niveomyces insectorum RCEF 264]|uniref:3-oxoacyl-[acyl-carrier-protein] reductase n=1 Tax=Niveomyces insectorum RCEF 264 TaxID=1081102 RepID=A0A167M2R9_9HYPO|nr:3-oxoacyl-[acyl-carrier-protein] reductase [Niveomyces insectorum RCEF 264]
MSSLKGSVIAVTGAASGMGLATAKLLATHGAHLSLADVQEALLRDAAAAAEAAAKAHGHTIKVHTAVVNVQDRAAVDAWIDGAVTALGRLDGAANIAGIFRSNLKDSVAYEEEAVWDLMLGVNLTGVMHCMRAELASMRAHNVPHGSIVNASSILGLQGGVGSAAYCASKHGVIGLTRAAAKEAGKENIRVNCFAPGFINTPMLRTSADASGGQSHTVQRPATVALAREGQPEEVAELIVFLLSKASSYITGQCISIDGGWNC